MSALVHDFIFDTARRTPDAEALVYGEHRLNYSALATAVRHAAEGLLATGIAQRDRVAIYLEKRVENVAAMFGAASAGAVFVPINPLLKPEQVAYILADCNVRVLVTSVDRLRLLAPALPQCVDLHTVIVVGASDSLPALKGVDVVAWEKAMAFFGAPPFPAYRSIDADMAAILYTSGSTGKPKGVVLSHRNMVAGAKSVATYLENKPADRILAVLPLSFDYGLSQLTTAFHTGAAVVLMNYLFPRDIVKMIADERITGLAAVPPLWIQLVQQEWPENLSLRYLTNSGGSMPRTTLLALRRALPATKVFLMYGLTEAFRSTYLPPSELDKRPDSIGRAIPNVEVMVVRSNGTPCAVDEPGELVHRGALVSLGYWNDPAKTAQRFKPVPGHDPALPITEIAVWSGDMVRRDEDGFLYFIGRNDDIIKVSGYRVSPTEVEEVLHATQMLAEVVALGVNHPTLGQAIVVLAVARKDCVLTPEFLLKECQRHLPAYMVPAHIEIWHDTLPRNPNGKIDRKTLQLSLSNVFENKLKI